VSLVEEWRRQAARAVGVSLIAPVALLVAAFVVAAGGGGLGGLGSLGQISSGPTLPDTGLASSAGRASLEDARLATAGLTAAADAAPGGTDVDPAGGSTPAAEGGPPGSAGGPGGPGGGVPPTIGTPRTQSPVPGGPPTTPSPPAPPTSAPPPPSAPPDPVGDLIEGTRGLGESLPAPLGPTTGDLLDSLLGPGR
jgi:hypothetical protein